MFFATLMGVPQPAFSADQVTNSGTQVSVLLQNTELPADDLMVAQPSQRETHRLSPAEAWQLKQQGLDLSTLDPDGTTDVWRNADAGAGSAPDNAPPDVSLAIQTGDTANFFGVISSSSGRFRFNVQTQPRNGPAETLTLMISKDVHTFLLRKELLRKLGYRIPEMKYLAQVRVRFPDLFSRDFFLRTQVTAATFGAASRWCSVAPAVLQLDAQYPCHVRADESDPLLVTLQDVVAMQATPLHYNTALGPPIEVISGTTTIRPETRRILRSLAIPYGLANVSESINQVDWHVGRISNGAYQFATPDEANFSCTLDDARWIQRRISKLTREDFVQIVAGAYYPDAVASVLVEKLISRRNSLNVAFGEATPALAFDNHVSRAPDLQNGKILRQDWPGYASRFAWGDPESPLRGLQWYVLSEVQSNVMATLLSKANAQIPQLSTTTQSAAHAKKLQAALTQYFNSGAPQTIALGVWAAPLVGGGIDLSRNVVIGNYMGTNNLVQLADNFGFNVNVGVMVGVDGLPAIVSVGATAQVTASVELTHIKPLKTLKSAITEPLRNEFVPLIAHDASAILRETAAYGAAGAPVQTPAQLKKALADTLDRLKLYLGVGESLILSESLNGLQRVGVSLGLQLPALPGASLEGDLNELKLARLHIYRKDQNTIQIFKDNGQLVGAHVAFEFSLDAPAQFPVLSLSAQKISGSAQTAAFTININPDPAQNPSIYANANALAMILRTGSVEVLAATQKPIRVATKFKESQSSRQFFHSVKRTLKSNGQISVALPDGTAANYISLSGGRQTGAHYQTLATEAASYLVQKLTSDNTLNVNTNAAPNPGHSFMGHSQTRSTELQARIDDKQLSVPMVRMQSRWEGWNISASSAVALLDGLSAQYGFKLFPDGFLMDTQSIKLYEIDLYVNLYQSAFAQLLAMTPEQEKALIAQTTARHGCKAVMLPLFSSPSNRAACNGLDKFREALATFREGRLEASQQAINLYNMAMDLQQFVDFPDLVKLVGVDHLYVYATINGFRIGSETLSTPLRSNTLGAVDPENPDGILDAVEQILGIDDGEFKMQWIRGVL